MPRSLEDARDYLRLLARALWQPGLQRRLDPSDLVHETLLQAQRKIDQCRATTDPEWRGWLRAILRNVLFQAAADIPPEQSWFTEASNRLEEIVGEQSSPSDRVLREEQVQQLAAALSRLLDDERTAVELKYLHGCSVRFISQHLDRTEDAVAGLLKRGMRKLRLLLQDCSIDERG
jgi:RNA polymerase sigma-70 factor (ECF subfamily)